MGRAVYGMAILTLFFPPLIGIHVPRLLQLCFLALDHRYMISRISQILFVVGQCSSIFRQCLIPARQAACPVPAHPM